MFQNDIQSVSGGHSALPHTVPQILSPEPLRKIKAEATAPRKTPLALPGRPTPGADTPFKPAAILYRNSAECRPYHHALHAFEGSQFGNDFICESTDFDHWFNAESYFCAAAFSHDDNRQTQILSLIAMLFVTETSALDLLSGKIAEQDLVPHSDKSDSAPVVYYSAMVSNNAMSALLLYKSILRDINAYKSKTNLAPAWGFSIALTEKAVQHLSNSGFYPIKENFLNKYHILKIDNRSAQAKIWTSIFAQPALQPEIGRMAKTLAGNASSLRRHRSEDIGNTGTLAIGDYSASRLSPALDTLSEPRY